MATFAGVHVSLHFGGVFEQDVNQLQILEAAVDSQFLTENTVSTISAPQFDTAKRQPIARIDTDEDIYLAIGPNPDPTKAPRHVVRASAGLPYDISVKPGAKFKYIPFA